MTMTPMLANFVPVDWMGSPFSPFIITVWECASMMKSIPLTAAYRSVER